MHHLAIETPLLHARLQFLTWSKVAGNAHGLTIEYDAQGRPVRFTGGTDPRGEGLARGH